MPDGYRGFYPNHDQGPAMARYIGEELPAVIERHFQVRTDWAGRAIDGLSLGGHGALRPGLGYAGKFCSVNNLRGGAGTQPASPSVRPHAGDKEARTCAGVCGGDKPGVWAGDGGYGARPANAGQAGALGGGVAETTDQL